MASAADCAGQSFDVGPCCRRPQRKHLAMVLARAQPAGRRLECCMRTIPFSIWSLLLRLLWVLCTGVHGMQVFKATGAAAALAAGIFHRKEVGIDEVKHHMAGNQVPTRIEA